MYAKLSSKARLVIAWALVVLWTVMILAFSSNSGADSSLQSGQVLDVFSSIGLPIQSEDLIRKLAHVFLYAMLAVWSLNLVSQYISGRPRLKYGLALMIPAIVSVIDEVNQMTTPGRSGLISDMLLDILSASLVLLIIYYLDNKTGD